MDEYKGEYLKQFPQFKRGVVGNLFYASVRAGRWTPPEALYGVQCDLESDLRKPWLSGESRELKEQVLGSLTQDDAYEYAAYVIERERASPEERSEFKAKRGEAHRQAYMETNPPTGKQIAYLKALGCPDEPQTRAEASRLIDEWLKKKRAA